MTGYTPSYDAQLEHILRSKVLAMDETPIKAGRGKPGKLKQAWFWPVYGQEDEVCFIFSPSRGSQVVVDALGEHFDGTLVTDGHSAYTCYAKNRPHVTQANCWAQARRKFEAALKGEPKAADQALTLIGRLYEVEKKALGYVAGRQAALEVFLSDPDVPIDTNHLERALRPIPMGRKNWLFSWTEVGARHIGIIQSLLATCRLHDINPYTYLVDVHQRIDQHPANRVDELVPRVWKETFAGNPLVSDLQRVSQ